MKKVLIPIGLFIFLVGAGLIVFKFYEYIFAKTIRGVIIKVERVNQENMVITSGSRPVPAETLFSFAVAIKDGKGEIHTASSEDRQWAVAQHGQCAEAKYFPYPPWQLANAGTFHNARLLRLHDCTAAERAAAEKVTAQAEAGPGAGIAPGEWDPPAPPTPLPTALPTEVPSPTMTLAPAHSKPTAAKKPHAGSNR